MIRSEDVQLVKEFRRSPVVFVQRMWKLEPQPVKAECRAEVDIYLANGQWEKIGPQHFDTFILGTHITWQQWLILKSVERALTGQGSRKITIVSGHGIGKSGTLSWLILCFLFCFMDAQVGATAPTSEQMHDVLWKELNLWLSRMPKEIADLYEWQSGYLRIRERSETWFARARTARKEAPEAIAGLHGNHVLIVGDEASGIPNEIFRSAEGSLTGPNVLVVLISNGTRNEGYFYDTHSDAREKDNWQRLAFDSEQSPIVDRAYVERMESKYGRDSDEFRIRVKGGFARSEQMNESGWIPLLSDSDMRQLPDSIPFVGKKWLGIDPSGEGDDTTRWVLRDRHQAKVVATEQKSTDKSIARRTYDLINEYEISPECVTVGNFGCGADVRAELLLIDSRMDIQTVNEGDKSHDELYLNQRAEMAFRGRDWLIRGGAIVGDELRRELLGYMYKITLQGKKKMLDKPNLRKRIGQSPDRGDAFFMSFFGDDLYEGLPSSSSAVSTSHIHDAI